MNNSARKLVARLFIAVCILGMSFIHSSSTEGGHVSAYAFEWGRVNSTTLNLRKAPSSNSKVLKVLKKGKKVRCYSLKTKWVKVTVGNISGYADGQYISTAYGTATSPYANVRHGTVSSSVLNVRASAGNSARLITVLKKGATVQVLTPGSSWVKVKAKGKIGYTQGKYIDLPDGGTASEPDSKGQKVIAYAKKFLGNPYVWGGESLTHGVDCSGFTKKIYAHFGYYLPHSSARQRRCGRKVPNLKSAKAGDLICYYGHVALYMGNNKIIHASNRRDGIKISYNAAYRPIAAIRRVLK